MIFYTKEQADDYIPLGGNRSTKVKAALTRMKVGEAITIEKGKDWVSKGSPYRVINNFAKKYNLKFQKERSSEVSGWWVRRIE